MTSAVFIHTELVGIREAIPSSDFAQVASVTALCTRLDALTATLASVEVHVGVLSERVVPERVVGQCIYRHNRHIIITGAS